MWAAFARFGNKVEKIEGGYRVEPSTDEQRLELLDAWRMSNNEYRRWQFYRRKRAWTKGWRSLLMLVATQVYANLFGKRERHVFRVIYPHRIGENPKELDRVVYVQPKIP